jgi:hypothetical protein
MRCFHVHTKEGEVYGVAATRKRDALQMVADRLYDEEVRDEPISAERVGEWDAKYGTVLHY